METAEWITDWIEILYFFAEGCISCISFAEGARGWSEECWFTRTWLGEWVVWRKVMAALPGVPTVHNIQHVLKELIIWVKRSLSERRKWLVKCLLGSTRTEQQNVVLHSTAASLAFLLGKKVLFPWQRKMWRKLSDLRFTYVVSTQNEDVLSARDVGAGR